MQIADKNTFQFIVESSSFANVLLLVDFHAAWCQPCKVMARILDTAYPSYKDQVTFASVDVDYCPEIATEFGVRSIPTLMLFKNGKPVDQLVGAVGRDKLDIFLKKYLDKLP